MSFFVEDKGGNFEATPPGAHLGRCYRIVDVGTQKSEYMGEVKFLHKIMLGWEILSTDDQGNPIRMQDGRPFGIFKNYTLSWSEKANLRLDLQSWRGKPFTAEEMRRFDLKNVLGAYCMLNVIERPGKDGKMYVNVAGVTPVPGMIKQNGLPEPVNKNEMFNLSDPDMALFQSFSENLKKKIQASPEWQRLQSTPMPSREAPGRPAQDIDPEDVPF
jgi:hypothetical protein